MPQIYQGAQWPKIANRPPIVLPTPHGDALVQLATPNGVNMLVVTSLGAVPVPVVRFQSACVFGEGLRATDCDCGVQLDAALKLILRQGGVLTYAWEEGRGLGIALKLDAIALQQELHIDTADAFARLGQPAEPRSFANHVLALRTVFSGSEVRLASRNRAKITALSEAGIAVIERIDLEIPRTPERDEYLASKIAALGHLE